MIQRKKRLPKPTKPIRARKKDPTKRRFAKHRDPAYEKWIESLPCLICGQRPVDPAHVRPRSLGSDDRGNLLPLCRLHHNEQEGKNAVFEICYEIDLRAEALALDVQYQEEALG